MAVKKSAKKKLRKDIKRRMQNRMAKNRLRTEIRKLMNFTSTDDSSVVKKSLREVVIFA